MFKSIRIILMLCLGGAFSQMSIAQDEPCSAIPFPVVNPCSGSSALVNYDFNCSSVATATGAGMASTGTVAAPTCSIDGNNDLFYRVDLPTDVTGFIIDIGSFSSTSRLTMNLYSYTGSCAGGDLALTIPSGVVVTPDGGSSTTECIDLTNGTSTTYAPISITGLTAGESYYLRVTEQDDEDASMELAFYESPVNDFCSGATTLTGNGCNYYATDTDEPDNSSWNGWAHDSPVQECNDGLGPLSDWTTIDNMVWYSFEITATTPQPITIEIENVVCDGGISTPRLQLGIFYQSTGSCTGGLGTMLGRGCATGTGTVSVTMLNNEPTGTYYVVADGDSGSNCIWNFKSDEVLPVELSKLDGYARENVNVIEWETASEQNNSHFEIQRSISVNRGFETIGEVKGNGTSAEVNTYTFTDEEPLRMGYYRLKQVDFDGTTDYSKVITVKQKSGKGFGWSGMYPNPANGGFVNVGFHSASNQKLDITLYNSLGQVVLTENIQVDKGNNERLLDISNIPSGLYTISLSDGLVTEVEKLVKN